ncbi:MAG: hypothetical protein QM675_12445 [Protaetiibacter sp.]
MSRRRVLQAFGIGGGAVVVAAASGVGTRAGLNGAFDVGQGAPYGLWSTWQDATGLDALVAAAVLAANPHNLQPWVFTIDGDRIDVYADPERAMPANDADERERIVGFGCALQNLAVAARARSLDAAITAFPDTDPDHIATIRITGGAAPTGRESALADAIAWRHSNRGPYTDEPPTTADLTALLDGAPTGADVAWVRDADAVTELQTLYVEATRAIVDDKAMSVESYQWFRSDRADVDRYRDGLTLDCQGLDDFTLFAAKVLPAQSRTDSDAYWVKSTRTTQIATTYGVIRVADNTDPAKRIAGGRLLQHVHLAATAAGLGVHHMNQITERIARDIATGAADRFGARWTAAIGLPQDEGLVSFRIGHPQREPNPSPRRPLGDVLATA